ncbi:hypothetical protein EUY87_00865 [Lactobacillus reuteri]|uniref:hypothetical protein n=1 Tax=Limosilactobacillus reuteri TaxID=1598 RepID=UPI0013D227E3|nr:hypothetical protein [Limosilactobacillus reuteri]NFB10405.1 hypothetical protein [Limosilactobacillus reuteri]
MIYPKIIRGYKATPHKIVRNIDGEWYESRPTKEIWPAGSDVPDVNGEYWGAMTVLIVGFQLAKIIQWVSGMNSSHIFMAGKWISDPVKSL